jgi:hypothetical protein
LDGGRFDLFLNCFFPGTPRSIASAFRILAGGAFSTWLAERSSWTRL